MADTSGKFEITTAREEKYILQITNYSLMTCRVWNTPTVSAITSKLWKFIRDTGEMTSTSVFRFAVTKKTSQLVHFPSSFRQS